MDDEGEVGSSAFCRHSPPRHTLFVVVLPCLHTLSLVRLRQHTGLYPFSNVTEYAFH